MDPGKAWIRRDIVARVTALAILQIGHPTLRAQAREVTAAELGSPELHRICDDLVETMRAANGAGLAAPQVDIPLRVFAVEVGDNQRYPYKPRLGLRVLVNPVVRPVSTETYASYEGCLSIPDRVEDPATLCTWEMFRTYHEEAWVESIQPLLDRFPGETETA